MNKRFRLLLLSLFLPTIATVIALHGDWGSHHQAFAAPLVAIIQLAYISAIWRVSNTQLRTIFLSSLLVSILSSAIYISIFKLYNYTVGGTPVWAILNIGILIWASYALVEVIGTDLRLNRISQVVTFVAHIGAAVIAFMLQDFQQLVLFIFFPIVYFIAKKADTKLLIGLTFFIGLTMEIYGVAVGAWSWNPGVLEWPTIGKGFANPPYGSGGLYVLTLGMVLILSKWLEPVVRVDQIANNYQRKSLPKRPRRMLN